MADYFKVREFDCRNGTPYPRIWLATRLPPLLRVCNAVREEWGSPLRVVSGFRTWEYNREIGGARNSQHPQGRAADLQPMNPKQAPAIHALVLRMYRAGKLPDLGGLGAYPTFVHVDVRPSKRLHRWSGSRVEN